MPKNKNELMLKPVYVSMVDKLNRENTDYISSDFEPEERESIVSYEILNGTYKGSFLTPTYKWDGDKKGYNFGNHPILGYETDEKYREIFINEHDIPLNLKEFDEMIASNILGYALYFYYISMVDELAAGGKPSLLDFEQNKFNIPKQILNMKYYGMPNKWHGKTLLEGYFSEMTDILFGRSRVVGIGQEKRELYAKIKKLGFSREELSKLKKKTLQEYNLMLKSKNLDPVSFGN